MEIAIVLEFFNGLLLLFLLYTYVQNYRQMKTAFGLGLIFFALFLLVENVLAAFFHLTMMNYYSPEAMQHALVLNAVQTIALAILAWITREG